MIAGKRQKIFTFDDVFLPPSEEIELLIEAIYNEPPDEQMLALIQTKRMPEYKADNGSLF